MGLIDYQRCREIQLKVQQELIHTERLDAVILCQHPPVITIGKSGSKQNLLISEQELKDHGIELYEVERGGDVTFHGPGQLVLYPLLNLHHFRTDVHWYMRQLEQVTIDFLQLYGIKSTQIDGKTGVWTLSDENGRTSPHERKIASIGVRISRWRTLHGLAVNIDDCSYGFKHINPCGYSDVLMTSVAQELGSAQLAPDLKSAQEDLLECFLNVFGAKAKD